MPRYTDDNNPYLKRLDALEKARKLWAESEWVLNFLRTNTGQPQKQLKDDELLLWYQNNLNRN
jgi:hypothetical protein